MDKTIIPKPVQKIWNKCTEKLTLLWEIKVVGTTDRTLHGLQNITTFNTSCNPKFDFVCEIQGIVLKPVIWQCFLHPVNISIR